MEEFLKVLAGSGVAGSVLAYHLWKHATELQLLRETVAAGNDLMREGMRKIEDAMDRGARADLMRLIASTHVAGAVKDSAAAILLELDTAEQLRLNDREKRKP